MGFDPRKTQRKKVAAAAAAGIAAAIGAGIVIRESGKEIDKSTRVDENAQKNLVKKNVHTEKMEAQKIFVPESSEQIRKEETRTEDDNAADVGFGGEEEPQRTDEFKEMTEIFRGNIESAFRKKMNIAEAGDTETLRRFRHGELYARESENIEGETQLIVREAESNKEGERIPFADKEFVTLTKHDDGSYTLEGNYEFTIVRFPKPESDNERLPGGMMEDFHQGIKAYSITGNAEEVGGRIMETMQFDEDLRSMAARAGGDPQKYRRLAEDFKKRWKNIFVDPQVRENFEESTRIVERALKRHKGE